MWVLLLVAAVVVVARRRACCASCAEGGGCTGATAPRQPTDSNPMHEAGVADEPGLGDAAWDAAALLGVGLDPHREAEALAGTRILTGESLR